MEQIYRLEEALQVVKMIGTRSNLYRDCVQYVDDFEDAKAIIQFEKDWIGKNGDDKINNVANFRLPRFGEFLVNLVENFGSFEQKCKQIIDLTIHDVTKISDLSYSDSRNLDNLINSKYSGDSYPFYASEPIYPGYI